MSMLGNTIWKIIEGAHTHNGHKNIEIEEMSIEELKSLVEILEENFAKGFGLEMISIRMYLEN